MHELVGHSRDDFIVTDHESGEIIGDVFGLTFVFEEADERIDGVSTPLGRRTLPGLARPPWLGDVY